MGSLDCAVHALQQVSNGFFQYCRRSTRSAVCWERSPVSSACLLIKEPSRLCKPLAVGSLAASRTVRHLLSLSPGLFGQPSACCASSSQARVPVWTLCVSLCKKE